MDHKNWIHKRTFRKLLKKCENEARTRNNSSISTFNTENAIQLVFNKIAQAKTNEWIKLK